MDKCGDRKRPSFADCRRIAAMSGWAIAKPHYLPMRVPYGTSSSPHVAAGSTACNSAIFRLTLWFIGRYYSRQANSFAPKTRTLSGLFGPAISRMDPVRSTRSTRPCRPLSSLPGGRSRVPRGAAQVSTTCPSPDRPNCRPIPTSSRYQAANIPRPADARLSGQGSHRSRPNYATASSSR